MPQLPVDLEIAVEPLQPAPMRLGGIGEGTARIGELDDGDGHADTVPSVPNSGILRSPMNPPVARRPACPAGSASSVPTWRPWPAAPPPSSRSSARCWPSSAYRLHHPHPRRDRRRRCFPVSSWLAARKSCHGRRLTARVRRVYRTHRWSASRTARSFAPGGSASGPARIGPTSKHQLVMMGFAPVSSTAATRRAAVVFGALARSSASARSRPRGDPRLEAEGLVHDGRRNAARWSRRPVPSCSRTTSRRSRCRGLRDPPWLLPRPRGGARGGGRSHAHRTRRAPTLAGFEAADQRFHEQLRDHCRNPLLRGATSCASARSWSGAQRSRAGRAGARSLIAEHEEIVGLIRSGAPAGEVEAAASRHVTADIEVFRSGWRGPRGPRSRRRSGPAAVPRRRAEITPPARRGRCGTLAAPAPCSRASRSTTVAGSPRSIAATSSSALDRRRLAA